MAYTFKNSTLRANISKLLKLQYFNLINTHLLYKLLKNKKAEIYFTAFDRKMLKRNSPQCIMIVQYINVFACSISLTSINAMNTSVG